jgi:2-phosphosulfolactate phosphatase
MAAERGDLLVIVDTLSFSTAVATAVHYGGVVYPGSTAEEAAMLAQRVGGNLAVRRREVPERGQYSLSPLTYVSLKAGTRVVLASPNGAACCQQGRDAPYLFVGALVNARALAEAILQILEATRLCVTVIACGERWKRYGEDEGLRVAVEDLLGAGALLSYLPGDKSPEARLGEGAFQYARANLEDILWECGSGRELREGGFGEDVRHAAQLNLYDAVPVMREGRLEQWQVHGRLNDRRIDESDHADA